MPIVNKRDLVLRVDGVDHSAAISSATITADDQDTDFVSFAQARSGGARKYGLKMTIAQDTDTTALWYMMYTEAGSSVPVEYWPNGRDAVTPGTPTAAYPRLAGTVLIAEPNGDLIGGDADKSATAVQTTELEWEFLAKPVLTP